MRVERLLIIVLSLLTAVLTVRAELTDDQIFDYLIRPIKGQIGDFDTELWEDVHSGGYLLQFSVDILGDHGKEDFLIDSMGLDWHEGIWRVFSGADTVGWAELSGIEFMAIREEDTVRLLHIRYGGLRWALVIEQTLSENGVDTERREMHPSEADTIIEQWKRAGEVIRPKIKAILLADFLRGSREWKAIDLTDEETIIYSLGSSGGRSHIVLRSDEARLSEMDFTPELALELLELSMRASTDTELDFVYTAQETSNVTVQEKVVKPLRTAQPEVEKPAPSERGRVWPWLVGALLLVLAGRLTLKRRRRNR